MSDSASMPNPALAYERLRSETVRLLGLDPAEMSLAQDLQVDLLALLRLEVDTLSGRVLAGEAVDLNRLSVAYGMLAKILPPAELKVADAATDQHSDARAAFEALIEGQIAAAEHVEHEETVRLRAEVAELRELLARSRAGAAPPAPAHTSYVDAGAGDGAPLSPVSVPMGMDDPNERAKRAESERIRAIATRPRLEEWRPYVGGGYSSGFGIHNIPRDF